MDTHDTPTISRDRKMLAGMVVTVEPGVYVPDTDDFPVEYRGIGIRIEDDVLVGSDAPIVLTTGAPKEVDEIESVMRGR